LQVVWFKKDLRITDHMALTLAARTGDPVLPLYIIEPEYWQQPDAAYRHYGFLRESLISCSAALAKLGQRLIIRVGSVTTVLAHLQQEMEITGVWSHQETGNYWTFQRDVAVKKWLKQQHIPWHEFRQNGVIRCVDTRDGWASRWAAFMQAPLVEPPTALLPVTMTSEAIPEPADLGLAHDGIQQPQSGGRAAALATLESFLHERGAHYTNEMSSPVTAYTSCSRLSPYLTFGCVSVREVYQIATAHAATIRSWPRGTKGDWPKAMRSFLGRLRWHCHFMQKLETAPRIEWQNMHSAYDQLREPYHREDWLVAWQTGKTGYPMVDASMRALQATGWINFRMRAMLVSFAAYHLWLHWQPIAHHLACLFTDYEPGIHYPQIQMQSGTTGMNTIRMYNPIKQGIDNDPEGRFIYAWIPELAKMPAAFIHTPWLSPEHMGDYPMPIVDEKVARKAAADRIYAVRKQPEHRLEAKKIVATHGSRKTPPSRRTRGKKPPPQQGELL
jgi:deoxyribodipyrimidine photo-lyase